MYDKIHRLSIFTSRIWQVHIFGEGNTRTTAVFIIKYLRSKGYNVTNDLFRENSWYFRNALVRANYTNDKKGISETTEYLELFFRNLLLGEKNELKNRYMHIGFTKGQEIVVNPIENIKNKYVELLKNNKAIVRTISNTIKLFEEEQFVNVFGRSDVEKLLGLAHTQASDFIKKLKEYGIIREVKGFGKGKYQFNSLV